MAASARTEAAMYVVIRKFSAMRSVPGAARRAESGIGQILKQSPGFVAYYVFDGGNGVGGSVTLFEDRGKANAANEKALAWIRGSLFDLIEGDPEISQGKFWPRFSLELTQGAAIAGSLSAPLAA